jgi:hypothetical protein
MEVTLDGEIAGSVAGKFDVVRGGLQVITPASFKNDRG